MGDERREVRDMGRGERRRGDKGERRQTWEDGRGERGR